jgi:hypothetical protein
MPGLLRGIARTAAIAGTATAGEQPRLQTPGRALGATGRTAGRPAPPAAAAPAAGGESVIDQLKELGELKDQGMLTEEEFAAQKAKLLG